MCRDLVIDDALQRDEQFFVWLCDTTESIVQQTLGHQQFHCQALLFVKGLPKPSYLFVSSMKFLKLSSHGSTSFARSRSMMLLIRAAYAELFL